MRPARLLALAPVLAVALAAPAHAATFCVADPTCPAGGVAQPDVGTAVAAAAASADADTVRVGPGRFTLAGTARVRFDDAVTGAGAGQTTIAGAFALLGRGSSLRDVTVELAPGQRTGVSAEGVVDGVTIDGPAGTAADAVGFSGGRGATFGNGTIRMAAGVGAYGNDIGAPTVTDSTIEAPVGVGTSYYGIDVVRTRIRATTGVLAPDGTARLDAVLIDLVGADATGVRVGPGEITPYPASLRHVTIRGSAVGQTGVAVSGGCDSQSARLTVDTTVVDGVGTALRRVSACGSGPDRSAQASLVVTRSAFDPSRVVSRGPGEVAIQAPVTDAPQLDADGVPVAGSALVDAGDPAEAAGTDLRGLTRPADGDGDGAAVADVGAFELQPPLAVPAAGGSAGPSANPAAGGVLGASQSRVAPGALRVRARRYVAKRPGRYAIRSRLTFPAGTDPSGAVTTLRAFIGKRQVGRLRTTMDSRGHADFKLRIRPRDRKRVRVQVRFGGTDSLTGLTSARVRVP